MLVVLMGMTILPFEREADQKSETPSNGAASTKSADALRMEAPLTFVRRVTQLKQELMHKLIWKRGSEQQ
jgi:hypothetical protein